MSDDVRGALVDRARGNPTGTVERLWTASEVARALRLSKATIYRLIDRGDIPALRLGKSVRIPHSAVTSLLRLHSTGHEIA